MTATAESVLLGFVLGIGWGLGLIVLAYWWAGRQL